MEIISDLKITSLINNCTVDSNAVSDSFSIATQIFHQHPSIINIKKQNFDSMLNSEKNSITAIEEVINNLNVVKACQKDDIPTKVIKWIKIFLPVFVAKHFNNCADKGAFQDDLKHADVTPVHKKKGKPFKTITDL